MNMKSRKKKVAGIFTNFFNRSSNLVTDAAPLADENRDEPSQRTIQSNQSSISQPMSSALEISRPLQHFDNQSTSLTQRNDSLMENGNSLALNNAQQNVYQFSQINGLHIGPVYSYSVNNVERPSDRRPRPDEPIKRTKTIDSMMKSDERINQKIMHVISMHLGEGWRVVARCLGLSDGQIDQMMEDHHIKGVQEVIYRILLDYSRNDDDASLGHITTVLWKNGFKECVFILKEHWKSGELAMPESTNADSSCKVKDVE